MSFSVKTLINPILAAGLLLAHSLVAAVEDVANIEGYTGISTGDLTEIRHRKVIRALVTYNQTDFFFHNGQPKGMQVELLTQYLEFLNKGIKREEERIHAVYIPVSFDELIPALVAGRGDIAADMLTITPKREEQVTFISGSKWIVNEVLVTAKTADQIATIEDLSGKKVYVLKSSSYSDHLKELNRKFADKKLAPVKIIPADSHLLSEDILEMINAGNIAMTVVDDYIAAHWKKVLPDIQVHEDIVISAGNHIGWAIRKQNAELAKSLKTFAANVTKGTLLGNMLFKRYYDNTRWISNPVSAWEMEKLKRPLALFTKYADKYHFDAWSLVALAYQESGLDHSRKSHRGAIGIMQMLPSTATDKNVDIKNITALENNIHAATKYLAFLRDRYFSESAISPENRMALTWAAYNAGPAKVRSMRQEAEKMGLDPNVWFGNVELAASKLVGPETVRYVAHVYKYFVAYKLADAANQNKNLAYKAN